MKEQEFMKQSLTDILLKRFEIVFCILIRAFFFYMVYYVLTCLKIPIHNIGFGDMVFISYLIYFIHFDKNPTLES